MAMSVVALHVAAKIIDFYITKYAAKPMEQLQNLVTQYALGLRRLELEEDNSQQAKQTTEGSTSDGAHLATAGKDNKAHARRVLLCL